MVQVSKMNNNEVLDTQNLNFQLHDYVAYQDHYLQFNSQDDALKAGFQPCGGCRP